MTISQRLAVLAPLALVALLATAPHSASAATYQVKSCHGALGQPSAIADSAWNVSTAGNMSAYDRCPVDQLKHPAGEGMRTYAAVGGAATTGAYSVAVQEIVAPAGATVAGVSYKANWGRWDEHWGLGFWPTDANGALGAARWFCAPGKWCLGDRNADPNFWSGELSDTFGSPGVAFGVTCANGGGCGLASSGHFPYTRAWLNLRDVTVTIDDPTRPALAPAGAAWADGWHTGTQQLAFDATDNGGVRTTRALLDGRQIALAGHCTPNETVVKQCGDVRGAAYAIDTKQVDDGAHTLTLGAWDRAGNESQASRTIAVDNTAPKAPAGLAVDAPEAGVGGQDWRGTNDFAVRWSGGDDVRGRRDASGIARARWRLVRGSDGTAVEGVREGAGIAAMGVTVPGPGEYTLTVRLEDGAGHQSEASDPVHLRFDPVVPGRAAPDPTAGWLSAARANDVRQEIRLGSGEARGPSGVAGYSVSTDGSEPDATIEARGEPATLRLGALPQGVTTVRARAVSGARLPSAVTGSTTIHVDRTPPRATVAGAPDPAAWSRQGVELVVDGTDQAGLSGMDPAQPGRPAEEGGRIVVRLDGGAAETWRGGRARVRVEEDGRHLLTYQAIDAAGNASTEGTVPLRIDRTPPETLAFEALDPADPRAISVVATDRASGVAGGSIELRRAGRGGWEELPTTLSGDRLHARLDDEDRPDGLYELRAVARDVAGNERSSDRRVDGSRMQLELPIRLQARIALSVDPIALRTCRRSSSRRRSARGRRCRTTTVRPAPATPLKVPSGRAVTLHGVLLDAAGRPIAGAPVEVLEQLRRGGAEFRRVAKLQTDPSGRFEHRAPAGASRTLRFAYAGTRELKPVTADQQLLVPAASTLSVSRRRVLNGQAVRFRGTLQGGPFPIPGKLVEVQVRLRGAWQPFVTVRANSRGAWSARKRFGGTPSTFTYTFRVRVRREASYPYELGYSARAVAVTVVGRG